MKTTRWALLAVTATLAARALGGCGARTGLLVDGSHPDAPIDAVVADVVDENNSQPLTCEPGRFTLTRQGVDVMFVFDRSGSMALDLEGRSATPRRWDVLRSALAATLPRYQDALTMGATAFPRRFDGNLTQSCQTTGAIDVQPAARNAAAVLDLLTSTEPWGATPTYDALRLTGAALVARITRSRSVAMVLATDGGPNCNIDLDLDSCSCTSLNAMGMPSCFGTPSNCLDDARTATLLAELVTQGVPTYVIGLDGSTLTAERSALDRLARAGGRPNLTPGQPAYYSVRVAASLTEAFNTVQQSVAACTLVTSSRPDDPSRAQVTLGGAAIARDETHANGWDWADRDFGAIAFFGAACSRVAASTQLPEVVVACNNP